MLEEQQTTVSRNVPSWKEKEGQVSIACFVNKKSERTYKIYSLQKSYKKGNEWINERLHLFERDLSDLLKLLDKLVKHGWLQR